MVLMSYKDHILDIQLQVHAFPSFDRTNTASQKLGLYLQHFHGSTSIFYFLLPHEVSTNKEYAQLVFSLMELIYSFYLFSLAKVDFLMFDHSQINFVNHLIDSIHQMDFC